MASSTRLLIRHVLQNLGYPVEETDEPAAATQRRDVSLIVLGVRAAGEGLVGIVQTLRAPERPPAVVLVGDAQSLAELELCRLDVQALLPEPLEFGAFLATVRNLTEGNVRGSHDDPATPDPASYRPVDLDRLDSFTGGDAELAEELAVLFFATARAYLTDMEIALRDDGDPSRSVHSLKGASANFGAMELAELAHVAEYEGVTPERVGGLWSALARAERFMTGAGFSQLVAR